MPGLRTAVLLGLAGFVAALVATLPLRWVATALPDSVECAVPTGTLWKGQCAALRIGANAVGTTSWTVRARELWLARLAADLSLSQPGIAMQGRVTVTLGGELRLHDLRGNAQLGMAFMERLAPNLRGTLQVDLAEAIVRDGWVRALRGTVFALDLQQTYPQTLALGNFVIEFKDAPAADGRITGRLQDRGGPLDVQGTLALLPQRGYELAGSVAARAEAPPQLAEQIRFLGSPDPAGRRQFAQSETF